VLQSVTDCSVEAAAVSALAPGSLLTINAREFRESFDRVPFLIQHNLCDHPLFRLERLLTLAQSLPEHNVEYNAGNLPIDCDPNQSPANGLTAAETVRRIKECQSWMALKYVDWDLEYRDLLRRCLSEIKPHSEAIAPGMDVPEAFIFLTSPGSVTPYHMDPEHNFLLQISGTKFVTVFERSLVSAEELERFYSGAHRNMKFEDVYLAKSKTFELKPGQGLHVPVAAPHYVRNHSSVSISFSITFRTPDLERTRIVHTVNRYLRRNGVHPSRLGAHPVRDTLKFNLYRAYRRTKSLLRPAP
jgi:hypothetical protein